MSVTPCVGVWIETMAQARASMMNAVTPCVGVWIETCLAVPIHLCIQSHPAWVCGLKLKESDRCSRSGCHTLRGCVD